MVFEQLPSACTALIAQHKMYNKYRVTTVENLIHAFLFFGLPTDTYTHPQPSLTLPLCWQSLMVDVICTCTLCRVHQVVIDGVEQPGQEVSLSTRSQHELQDENPKEKRKKHYDKPNVFVSEKLSGVSIEANIPKSIDITISVCFQY